MKKIFLTLAAILGPVSGAVAQSQSGFSIFQISWSSALAPTAVPTMSTYAIILLAVLLTLVVFRVSRNRGLFLRAIAPLATIGVATAFILMSESPIAGILAPPIGGGSCSGSEIYTVNDSTPPPCFVNSCGSPVTVTYTFLEGETADSTPITEGGCTMAYSCIGNEESVSPAFPGAEIPSDETPYGTAFCEEIFDFGEEGPG